MSGDAKLRELRESFVEIGKVHGGISVPWALDEIDRMLAEPDPQCDYEWLCGTMRCRCTLAHGHAGAHRDEPAIARWERGLERLPRKSMAEEVARLHGFVGPDGRGRA